MRIRVARPDDAPAISAMLEELVLAGKRTSPTEPRFVLETYIANPNGILCSLSEDDRRALLGLQSLILSTEGNRYGTPVGWGIIGTHVSPRAARQGVGSELFEVSKAAAMEARLRYIEASIASSNREAQAYYEKMGFRTYRIANDTVCKCWAANSDAALPLSPQFPQAR